MPGPCGGRALAGKVFQALHECIDKERFKAAKSRISGMAQHKHMLNLHLYHAYATLEYVCHPITSLASAWYMYMCCMTEPLRLDR